MKNTARLQMPLVNRGAFRHVYLAGKPQLFCSKTEKQPPRDWDPLVKQTYSVFVTTEKGPRKWHLSKFAFLDSINALIIYSRVFYSNDR